MEVIIIKNERLFKMSFASVYILYIQKAEKKGRTKSEVDMIICWLTGYNQESLLLQIENNVDLKTFYTDAPTINIYAGKIKGKICGISVEDIEDPLMKNIRLLDKLIDELTKGKEMTKILRE